MFRPWSRDCERVYSDQVQEGVNRPCVAAQSPASFAQYDLSCVKSAAAPRQYCYAPVMPLISRVKPANQRAGINQRLDLHNLRGQRGRPTAEHSTIRGGQTRKVRFLVLDLPGQCSPRAWGARLFPPLGERRLPFFTVLHQAASVFTSFLLYPGKKCHLEKTNSLTTFRIRNARARAGAFGRGRSCRRTSRRARRLRRAP